MKRLFENSNRRLHMLIATGSMKGGRLDPIGRTPIQSRSKEKIMSK